MLKEYYFLSVTIFEKTESEIYTDFSRLFKQSSEN